ncbi:polysaccharide deacetylase family protein [Clostridium lundense]|uniref:polysaccharide deacetylase family protein n=1 Tax=Clostridium lundense TaxID=319475 RepID=UPI0009FD70AA|nr:polysaccharide deacetylase family protein [Clostridium lundense]
MFSYNFFNTNYSIANSNVINTPNINVYLNHKKLVYLTFDDGPAYIVTDEILNILKNYNVKATFFVVGKEIQNKENILLRIYKEGHSIGLHSYSHDYKKLYSAEEIFINEMITTREKVKSVTGYTSTIIRFPGGSMRHLDSDFLEKLHNNSFKVYDWNISLSDGTYPNLSPDELLSIAKSCTRASPILIVLMHCNFCNENTAKVLPSIIKYYKNLGYEFKTINNDTEEYYFTFSK